MPPCTAPIFMQVFERVLPIDEDNLAYFKTWQENDKNLDSPTFTKQKQTENLVKTGNYRETNILDDHDPVYLISNDDRDTTIIEKHGDLALLGVLLSLAAALTCFICYFLCPSFKEALPDAPDLDDQGEEEENEEKPVINSEQPNSGQQDHVEEPRQNSQEQEI